MDILPDSCAMHKDPRDHYAVGPTPDSVARAKADAVRQRLEAGADPETGILRPRKVQTLPIRASGLSREETLDCVEFVSRAIAKWGFWAVTRAVFVEAQQLHVDIEGRTLSELAAGEEKQ